MAGAVYSREASPIGARKLTSAGGRVAGSSSSATGSPTDAQALSKAQASAMRASSFARFLTIGILPLVPGGGIYYTMEYCVSGQTSQFIETGIHTFAIAGALAVGVLIVSSLVRLFHMMHIIKRFKNLRAKFAKI